MMNPQLHETGLAVRTQSLVRFLCGKGDDVYGTTNYKYCIALSTLHCLVPVAPPCPFSFVFILLKSDAISISYS